MLNPIRTGSASVAADVATAPSVARIITAAKRQAARIEEHDRLYIRSPPCIGIGCPQSAFHGGDSEEKCVARPIRGSPGAVPYGSLPPAFGEMNDGRAVRRPIDGVRHRR